MTNQNNEQDLTVENSGNNGYTEDSITALKNEDQVRLRPGVMFGTDDINGSFHTFKEIAGNSLDEARSGFGKKVDVVFHADGSITVTDFGRGVPMGYNDREQKFNWDLVYNTLYAGGKYKDLDGADEMTIENVEYPIGLNGLGGTATQFTSEFFEVISRRAEAVYSKRFKKGVPVNSTQEELAYALEMLKPTIDSLTLDDVEGDENESEILRKARLIALTEYISNQAPIIEPNETGVTGTSIHWKPDLDVFTSIDFTTPMFTKYLESQAFINSIDITFKNEKDGTDVEYHGTGIQNYLEEKVGDKLTDIYYHKVPTKQGTFKGKKYFCEAELVLAITEEMPSIQLHYHNTGGMVHHHAGVHHQAFEAAVDNFFKEIGKENGVKIGRYDYDNFISILSSTYSTQTSFANQTKDAVSNDFIYWMVHDGVTEMLREGVAKKSEAIVNLIKNVVNVALARQKAKEFEKLEKQANKISGGKKFNKPAKYLDPRKYDERTELFLVEGDSAATSCEAARDSEFQAILPLKGKPINALKTSIDKLLDNDEVKSIIATIGTGIDISGNSNSFDITKCRFSKIIILTDADVDGEQIRVLCYTIFATLMPDLLKAGIIYIAESPLFTIKLTDKTTRYAYTVDEYEKVVQQIKSEGKAVKVVRRSKGLGSNNKDMMWDTTMNPETRRLTPLEFDPADPVVHAISQTIFGDADISVRKDFVMGLIEENLKEEAEILKAQAIR